MVKKVKYIKYSFPVLITAPKPSEKYRGDIPVSLKKKDEVQQ